MLEGRTISRPEVLTLIVFTGDEDFRGYHLPGVPRPLSEYPFMVSFGPSPKKRTPKLAKDVGPIGVGLAETLQKRHRLESVCVGSDSILIRRGDRDSHELTPVDRWLTDFIGGLYGQPVQPALVEKGFQLGPVIYA